MGDSDNLRIYVELDGIGETIKAQIKKLKKIPKIKKIIRDGYGFNYGVKSELSPKSRNNHVLWIQEAKISIRKKLAETYARLEKIVDEI